MLERRTKIVATLGPATDDPAVLDALVAAGLDCARLNCSHGTPTTCAAARPRCARRRERAGRPLALLLDLQGPKLRLRATTAEPGGRRRRQRDLRLRRRRRRRRAACRRLPRFAAPGHRPLGDRDRRRRAALRRRARRRADEVVARAVSPGPLVAAQGHQRHLRAARAAGDHREGRRRPRARRRARRRLRRALVRALGGRHRAAARPLAAERGSHARD